MGLVSTTFPYTYDRASYRAILLHMFVERTSDVICERARFGRDRPDLIHSLLERPVLVDIRRHRDSMRLLSFASTRI
jgi:hypothetical protein